MEEGVRVPNGVIQAPDGGSLEQHQRGGRSKYRTDDDSTEGSLRDVPKHAREQQETHNDNNGREETAHRSLDSGGRVHSRPRERPYYQG